METKSELRLVRDFMEANGQIVRFRPVDSIPEYEKMLRLSLILEEVYELAEALNIEVKNRPTLVAKSNAVDPVESLDALTDILYVVFGTYHTLGLGGGASPAFAAVHASNMSKLGPDNRPIYNDAGKVMKGPFYRPPDISSVIEELSKPHVFEDPAQ